MTEKVIGQGGVTLAKINAQYYASSTGKKPVYEHICSLDSRTRQKFFDVVELLEYKGHMLPEPHAKYLGNDVFELRFAGVEGAVRVLYFFFHRDSAVLTNSFLKKTPKTPINELDLAIARRKDYLERNK